MFRALSRKLVIFNFRGRIHSVSRMLYRVLDIRSGVECIFGNRFTRPRLKYADNSTLFVFYNHKYYAVRLELSKHGSCARPRHSTKKFKPKLMNNQWLIIEQIGEDVVLKKCSQEAEGTIVVPENVTRIEKYAFCRCEKVTSVCLSKLIPGLERGSFHGSGIETIVVNSFAFYCDQLTPKDASEIYAKRNSACNKAVLSKDDPDKIFKQLYQNFLLHKDCLLNILKGEYYQIQSENAYFYLEKFIYERFAELSEENQRLAAIFMEHFSRSSVAGPSYSFHIYAKNLDRPMAEAEARLAAAVYNLSTPWGNFAKYNCIYLAKIHMLRSWESKDKLRAESAAILFRHKEYLFGGPAHSGVFHELDVNVEDLVKNEFKAYYDDYFNPVVEEDDVKYIEIDGRKVEYHENSANFKKMLASRHREEGLTEEAVASILCEAAGDICKRIASAEELEMTPFLLSLLEFFSNPDNYRLFEDVDVEESEHKEPDNEDSYFEETLKALEHAHATHLYRIHFKSNKKFQSNYSGIFYMGFSDGWDYTIRERKGEVYDDSNDPIVVTYQSMRDVLMDGWLPD